ncbi:MAG: hypothetical protein KKH94_07275 [Candidatus Omnitrophica bacterium]|nr:hypothetical protein [Candidatus Omnitrophota bacterium]
MKKTNNQRKERRKYVREKAKNSSAIEVREKRKYIRGALNDTITFTACSHTLTQGSAASLDVSQNGILFITHTPPKIGALITLKVNQQLLKRCLELEKLLQENNGEILGKAVRVVKEKDTNNYQIAVAFLKKGL